MSVFLEILSVLCLLIYLLLATRQNQWCWLWGGIGSGLYAFLMWQNRLYGFAIENLYYVIVAFYGFAKWKDRDQVDSFVKSGSWIFHIRAWMFLLPVVILIGYLLEKFTNQEWAYIDVATSISAFFATWLLARKHLENWIYWIVIDIVVCIMMFSRGFAIYGCLYVGYTFFAVYGFSSWRATSKMIVKKE